LAVHFAGLLSLHLAERQATRAKAKQFREMATVAEGVSDDVAELMDDLIKHRRARTKGADGRWADDPTQLAKSAARELWPTAHRKGWTATQFHTELTGLKHAIPYDTARKWLTKLRQTGTC